MKYEFTFLLKEEAEQKNIKGLIETFGKIVKEESWGEKTLAYPIKKNKRAYFFNWLIEIPQNKINSFRQKLNFDSKIIRYLLLVKN